MTRSPREPSLFSSVSARALGAAVETRRRSVSVSVRRSAGCVSTAWRQPMCEMLNTRSAGRQAGLRSMTRSPREPSLFSSVSARALGAAVETRRRSVSVSVRRSAGCVSTAWRQPMCEMLNTRSAGRQAGLRSMTRSPREPSLFSSVSARALGAAVETRRRSVSVSVRRSAGCVSTAWRQPMCEMLNTR